MYSVVQDNDNNIPLNQLDDDNTLNNPSGFRTRSSSSRNNVVSKTFIRFARNPISLFISLAILLMIIVSTAVSGSLKDEGSIPEPIVPKPPSSIVDDKRTRYDFDSLSHYILSASTTDNLAWTKSGLDGSYVVESGSSILLKHIEFSDITILVASDAIKDTISFSDYFVSGDLKHVLVTTDHERGWRHSYFANYYLFAVKSMKTIPLTTTTSDKIIPGELGSGKVSLATWAPTADRVAWVRDNDLFVTWVGDSTFESRITNDGSKSIINGICDWVYEEEVLVAHEALWFSPDGVHLAYLKFNETLVPEYKLQLYETPHTSYPREVSAGFPNPVVTLHIATPSITNGSDVAVIFKADEAFAASDRLIVEAKWLTPNDTLLVRLMNRVQDTQRIFLVKPADRSDGVTQWNATLIRDERNEDDAWFNILQPVTVVEAHGDRVDPSYIEMKEDADGFTHLAYFGDIANREPTAWLTRGAWEVTKIVGVDVVQGIVYYLSTEVESTQRHLYSLHLNGSAVKKLSPPKNLSYKPLVPMLNWTIPNIEERGDAQPAQPNDMLVGDVGFYAASFTPLCSYYILTYNGPDIPFSRVVKVGNDQWFKDLDENVRPRAAINQFNLPLTKYFTIKNDQGDDMNAKMVVPPGFLDDGTVAYPMLMRVYGGPNSQTVTKEYGYDYMTMIANAGFIVLIVDGRGTGFKGRKYRACVSRNLGDLEVKDQIAAASYMAQIKFVDEKRIGIWGWSYGGYVASKVIEANSKVIGLGMAVAPVTDWRYYDSVYTERYMKLPADNFLGYEKSSVKEMQGFKESEFLLIHGLSDDNVHFQHSADLIWHLTGAHIRSYRVQVYTDSDHSIAANGANSQVYRLLRDFLFERFNHTTI